MVFHEITPEAIALAVANPREMDNGLVEAYQTRRVLDRLYGYEVSPVLWKKVMPQLSAGRVQSVAVRLVVDRERERIAFRAARYWDLEAVFAKAGQNGAAADADVSSFPATLVSVDGRRVAQGRDFTSAGELRSAETPAGTEDGGRAGILHLDGEAAAMDEIIPFGNDIVHRTSAVALAEGHPAVHAAGRLGADVRLRNRTIKLAPVSDALFYCLTAGRRTANREECFRVSHDERSTRCA